MMYQDLQKLALLNTLLDLLFRSEAITGAALSDIPISTADMIV